MNILIVEDEIVIANSLKNLFNKMLSVNIVDTANNFNDGFDKSLSNVFDIILLDINLGGELTGIDLCKIIKKNNPNIPVIMITVNRSLNYLEEAFNLGANDYITKPFNSRELCIRVQRWFSFITINKVKDRLVYNDLSYDINTNTFFWENRKIEISKKNKVLLLILLRSAEKLLTGDYIREKLWGDHNLLDKTRNLRSNIQGLRITLKNYCETWIQTVRGEGYILSKNKFTK